jgi:hypothetical protein
MREKRKKKKKDSQDLMIIWARVTYVQYQQKIQRMNTRYSYNMIVHNKLK